MGYPTAELQNSAVFSDGLGHHQQDWLCCAHLSEHERLGRHLGERRVSSLQLFSKVRQCCLGHPRQAGICLLATGGLAKTAH